MVREGPKAVVSRVLGRDKVRAKMSSSSFGATGVELDYVDGMPGERSEKEF